MKKSLDGQDARQKLHSLYCLPLSWYKCLPSHSVRVKLPARTGTYSSFISSATTRMRDRAGLTLLYLGLA